jgi:hypothetical protein
MFLSSLAIIFPNANLSDQVDLPLKLHPAAIGALGVDTPCGAVGARFANCLCRLLADFVVKGAGRNRQRLLEDTAARSL